MKPLRLYDTDMSLVAILENATDKGYTKKLNDLWQATFSMPANDPKAKLCTPFRIVELFDGEERVDLFRILPSSHSSDDTGEMMVFNCEHVLATLIDDILFQYHERNNVPTEDVLEYILGFQTTPKWQLGQVDFTYMFSYKWESENLLGSIFSVPEPFVDEYQWTWDTTTQPWTLNLIAPSAEVKTWIRYGRNLKNVEKRTDPTNLCTRLYGLGYGEGVNQLTISEVNSGLPYIEADTVGTYGVIARIYTDTKEENATTLKGKMEAILEQLKIPRMEYTVGAAHLHKITDKSIDDFYLGAYCKTIDKEDELTFTARVVTITKPDIDGAPGDIEIEIANSPQDVAKSISSLANRQRINEVYAQGATNIMANDYTDNCDPLHPAVIKFYIPEETVRINKLQLNYESSAFRAYSKATTGGGDHRHRMFEFLGGDMMFTDSTSSENVSISGTTGSGGDPSHSHSFSDSASHSHDYEKPFRCTTYRGLINPDPLDPIWATIGLSEDYSAVMSFDLYTADSSGEHTHDIEYGIYEGTTHTAVTVEVDGTPVPGLGVNENDVDLVPYLSTDANGKIQRGAWHEIRITPNDLGRISASVITQFFIQSRGGGNY